jgi:hypothetical protein
MKKFLKELWDALITDYSDISDEPESTNYYQASRQREKPDSWCPFCGYNGTADELRCHLLNDHKQ